MGFYVRKAFSFGPIRLNLSRSGLGASFGVKGARIGVGPRGTYIHAGRGGFYYRQTIVPRNQHTQVPEPSPAPTTDFQAISSSAAQPIVDSSADQLLHELNRVTKRRDLFTTCVIAGVLLLVRSTLTPIGWWLWIPVILLAVTTIAIIARHCDVTDGTLLLQYSFTGESGQKFSCLQNSIRQLSACQRIWHVDANQHTDDWKRHAGASTISERSAISVGFTSPPKTSCNVEVPMIKGNGNTLYLFPDRLLIRDSTGLGAVSYSDLQARAGLVEFVESESLPQDAVQIGTQWLYPAKHGGPDRRFSNNRQFPIMSYGTLSLASRTGLNEQFQCSVPQRAQDFCGALGTMGTHSELDGIDVSFAAPEKERTRYSLLWFSILVMFVALAALPLPESLRSEQQDQTSLEQKLETRQRERLAMKLDDDLHLRNVHAVVIARGTQLNLRFFDQTPKAARQYGLVPFERKAFGVKVLKPTTESDLCKAGFRTIQFTVNESPANTQLLACVSPIEKKNVK